MAGLAVTGAMDDHLIGYLHWFKRVGGAGPLALL
jgi:hypothetical protein